MRDIIEEEMEQALDGKKTAAAALKSAVARGNAVLRNSSGRTSSDARHGRACPAIPSEHCPADAGCCGSTRA